MKIQLTSNPKAKTPSDKLVFGHTFTDHMYKLYYNKEKGWHGGEIVPYAPLELDPSTAILHYGQAIFEGAKAFYNENGSIALFRIRENFIRMNNSGKRLCIPPLDVDMAIDGLKQLIKVEKDWVPKEEGTSLYIRPTIIGTDPFLGVHASNTYLFFIILSPVGAYYKNGLKPIKIVAEHQYIRAAIGGTGEAKCGGNYASSLLSGERAAQSGYDQVMWLDANESKYVEEVGSMNMFFVINDVVVTPMLNGSILPGITRRSVIQLLTDNGYKVEERKVSLDEVLQALKSNTLNECFGTGTAAVISPVGVINYKGKDYTINNNEMGKISRFLYDTVTGIQKGRVKDKYGWIEFVE